MVQCFCVVLCVSVGTCLIELSHQIYHSGVILLCFLASSACHTQYTATQRKKNLSNILIGYPQAKISI